MGNKFRRLFKDNSCLIVGIGLDADEIKAIEYCINEVVEFGLKKGNKDKKLKKPDIEFWAMEEKDVAEIKEIVGKIRERERIEKDLTKKIFDKIDAKNTMNNVAIVFSLKVFYDFNIFNFMINHSKFSQTNYYPICFQDDFYNLEKRKKCLEKACNQCNCDQSNGYQCTRENTSKCKKIHSCLLFLIANLFEMNNPTKTKCHDIVKEVFFNPLMNLEEKLSSYNILWNNMREVK